MVIIKKLFSYVLLPVILVFVARTYVIGYAIKSFKFGCDTAADRAYKFEDKEMGIKLRFFCQAYTSNIRKEFNGEFDR